MKVQPDEPQAVVPVESPEEREYARYLAEIDARHRRIADLDVDLAALTQTLGRFEALYHARVGRLFVELDRVRLANDEYERRITGLQRDSAADPETIEREVRAASAGQRRRVEDEDEETRRYEDRHRREAGRPRLTAGDEDELKRLYRDLARRFHPDLATTDDDRSRRAPLMQRTNAAMRERDLDALRALSVAGDIADPAFERLSIGEKLVWAIREVARLDGVIATLEGDLAALQASETHALWLPDRLALHPSARSHRLGRDRRPLAAAAPAPAGRVRPEGRRLGRPDRVVVH